MSRLVETSRPGYARDPPVALPQGACDAVVVVGGDGTLHEAISGLMATKAPKPPLGAGMRVAPRARLDNEARKGSREMRVTKRMRS